MFSGTTTGLGHLFQNSSLGKLRPRLKSAIHRYTVVIDGATSPKLDLSSWMHRKTESIEIPFSTQNIKGNLYIATVAVPFSFYVMILPCPGAFPIFQTHMLSNQFIDISSVFYFRLLCIRFLFTFLTSRVQFFIFIISVMFVSTCPYFTRESTKQRTCIML